MNKAVIPVLISALSVSACTTFDAFTGEKQTSKTTIGASIGAGVGAVVAYVANRDKSSEDRRKRILRAAGVGAIAGGGVGYYMDTQEAKLREQLQDSGVSVQRDGDNINLVLPGNITFATGKSDIQPDFNKVLDSVVLVLNEYDKTLILVSGHTDSVGSEESNMTLSKQRADSVGQYLLAKGVIEARVETIGLGEGYPIADNATPEGRAQNRRVELTLLPITEE